MSLAAAFAAWGTGLAAQDADAATLTVTASDEFGPYIQGPDGRPVYALLTDLDTGDGQDPLVSCEASCRNNWPVLTSDSEVTVGDELDAALADTLDQDGETVVQYADHPLFQFYRDRPGEEPQGQGIFSFGGYWALLSPSGETMRTDTMPEPGETADPD
jgi:predicted lipoprotein with Yx(FWY)xxD motif